MWKVERDLKRANKGKAWAHKVDHILQAKKEVLEGGTVDAEMGIETTAAKRRKAILERAHMLAQGVLNALTEGASLEAFSEPGRRMEETADISDEYDKVFTEYMEYPLTVTLRKEVEALEATFASTGDHTPQEKGDEPIAYLKALDFVGTLVQR